jgi:hypothetical protein
LSCTKLISNLLILRIDRRGSLDAYKEIAENPKGTDRTMLFIVLKEVAKEKFTVISKQDFSAVTGQQRRNKGRFF